MVSRPADAHPRRSRPFAIGIALNVAFILVEVIAGLRAHSLALIADAGHNLSDVLSLLLAWAASYLSSLPPTRRHTYGLRRSSILAALVNAVLLLIAVGVIASEAIRRLRAPQPAGAGVVMAVAGLGVLINGATALLFLRGRKHDLNLRAAFWHMAADAGVSLGVLAAGLGIYLTGREWLDPAASLAVAAVITAGTWGLLRESLNLALDAVPAGTDLPAIEAHLATRPGVVAVHDLHVWALSTTETALTAHLVLASRSLDDDFLVQVTEDLRARFGIHHATLQLEHGGRDHPCDLVSPDRG